jgi:hypothetical protein
MATVIPAKAGTQVIDNTGFPVKPGMTERGAGGIFQHPAKAILREEPCREKKRKF